MKNVKKLLRVFALIFLFALALIGVGLSGGIPIPTSGRKEDRIEIVAEDNEDGEEENEEVR